MDFAQLVETLTEIFARDTIDILYELSNVLSLITRDTAPVVLAFLRKYFKKTRHVPSHLQASFLFFSEEIFEAVRSNTPETLHSYIPVYKPNKANMLDTSEPNLLFDSLQEIAREVLVKSTSHEIEAAINSAIQEPDQDEPRISPQIIVAAKKYGRIEPASHGMFVRCFALLISEEDLPALLNFSVKNEEFAVQVFAALRLGNPAVFEKVLELITTEKRYFKTALLKAAPEVDVEMIMPIIKPYNWEVLSALLNIRPDSARTVIREMVEGRLTVSRRFFIDKICEQPGIFSHFVTELNLSSEETSEIIRRSPEFLQQYFIQADSESMVADVAKIISQKDESSIISFIENNRTCTNFEAFLKILAAVMRFTGRLKTYVVDNFAKRREFFHSLITYLPIEDVEYLLIQYFEHSTSVEALLRRFHPQELLLELHKFKDISLASTLISECASSNKFSDADWLFAIKTLEGVKSEAKMKTCISLLKRRPHLRTQVIAFVYKSINEGFWHSKILCADLEKALEMLGPLAVPIFENIHREDAVEMLQRFPVAREILEDFCARNYGKVPPRVYALRRYLHEFQER